MSKFRTLNNNDMRVNGMRLSLPILLCLFIVIVASVNAFSTQTTVAPPRPTMLIPTVPSGRAYASSPFLPKQQQQQQQQKAHTVLYDAFTNAGNEDFNNNYSKMEKLKQCGKQSCEKFSIFARRWMSKVWKLRKKGMRLVAVLGLALSALYFVQQPLQQSNFDNLIATGRTPTPTTVVMQNSPAKQMMTSSQLQQYRGGGESLIPPKAHWKSNSKTVEEAVVTASISTSRTFKEALIDLAHYMKGPKSDTLLLLLATALITPVCKRLGTSPILGFLASGMLLGPNGCGLISGIHTTETLAELGIVFFLFEMGIELSFERLLSMRRDVFGLGFSQFICTALAVAAVGGLVGLPANALVVLGGGIALSSSAFVLQLLKDKNQLATRFGKASFGILLFQDLAVVPLLVVTPILAGGGGGLAAALGSAVLKAGMALGSITLAGRYLLNPLFKTVAQSQSQEAFLGVILLTVLSMSFMTEGLGLSNTLGAFLAGVLLSETKYRYQVEADIAPFRGVLLGLFFVTVGFEIDLNLVATNLPVVGSVVFGILLIKALITTALSMMFGLSLSTSQQTGLILSQGGEFAFVAFGLARSLGILDKPTTKLMLTCVSLTMALTPAMAGVGSVIAKKLEEKSDFTHYLGQDRDANEIKESEGFVVVVGYGAVGKVVCDLLDRKLIRYVGIDIDPNKAIQARNKGLPVFYGDIGRQEVADAFNVGKAKAVIVCISDRDQATRAAIALRRFYPDVKIFCRAKNKDHAYRLQSTLDVVAMVPILPEDNLLLTLPFGGAVLRSLGASSEEVNAILESKRKELLSGRGLESYEEETTLMQLGIEAKEVIKLAEKDLVASQAARPSNSTLTNEAEEAQKIEDSRRQAAVERLEEAKDKSPFVAQVIGEVCHVEEIEKDLEKAEAVEVEMEVLEETKVAEEDDTPKTKEIIVEAVQVSATTTSPSSSSSNNNSTDNDADGPPPPEKPAGKDWQ